MRKENGAKENATLVDYKFSSPWGYTTVSTRRLAAGACQRYDHLPCCRPYEEYDICSLDSKISYLINEHKKKSDTEMCYRTGTHASTHIQTDEQTDGRKHTHTHTDTTSRASTKIVFGHKKEKNIDRKANIRVPSLPIYTWSISLYEPRLIKVSWRM